MSQSHSNLKYQSRPRRKPSDNLPTHWLIFISPWDDIKGFAKFTSFFTNFKRWSHVENSTKSKITSSAPIDPLLYYLPEFIKFLINFERFPNGGNGTTSSVKSLNHKELKIILSSFIYSILNSILSIPKVDFTHYLKL